MRNKYLYYMAGAHLCNDVNTGALPALLPFFVTEYGMDYTKVAGLMFASSFLASVIQPLFGYLADRSSKQWFMGLGVIMTGGFLSLTGFLENYWLIFAAVTMTGIGSSIFHPEAARLVNKLSGSSKGKGISIFSVGGNAGFGIGPLLAVLMISLFGMHGMALFAIIGLVMGCMLLYLAPKLKELSEQSAMVEKQEHEKAPKEDYPNDWHSFGKLTLLIILRSTVSTGIRSFLPLFCIQVLMASHAAGSATLSVLSLMGILSTLIGGRLADRFGCARILKLGCILMGPLLALAILSNHMILIYCLIIPLSLAVQGTYAPFVVLGQSYLNKNVGFASGITLGVSFSAGGMLVPAIGKLADLYTIETAMWVTVLVAVGAALVSLLLSEPAVLRHQRKS